MARQFGRILSVLVGKQLGLEIKDLFIQFEVIKTLSSDANKATIKIYNLSTDTREQIRTEFERVVIKAGYESNAETIFSGNITKVSTASKLPDIITMITCGDGDKDLLAAATSLTVAGGVDIKGIVKQVIGDFEEAFFDEIEGVTGSTPPRGLTLSGSTKQQLDDLGEMYGFTWSIQDGQVETLAKDTGSLSEVYVLAPDTGLIGTPKIEEEGKIEATALLNPRLKPGRRMIVRSKAIAQSPGLGNNVEGQGLYRITKVKFRGDNRKGPFDVTLTGEVI